MTLEGTVNKTGILLALVVISAFYTWSMFFSTGNPASVMPIAIGGAIVGFVLALVTIFKKQWSGTTAPLYAIAEGLFLGAISAIFEAQYPGIVICQLTLGTLASLLFFTNWYRKTNRKLPINGDFSHHGNCYALPCQHINEYVWFGWYWLYPFQWSIRYWF